MLNFEYARLVEQDRRRQIAVRIKLRHLVHPDDPGTDGRPAGRATPGRGMSPVTGAPTVAR